MVLILNQLRTIFFTVPCTSTTERRSLLSTIESIDNNLLDLFEPVLIKNRRFGSNSFDSNANTNVINVTIEYVLSTKRYEDPLFQ